MPPVAPTTRTSQTREQRADAGAPVASLPAATPGWITPDLVAYTIRVWQPRYPSTLSTEDAIDIISGAARLLRVLCSGGPDEHRKEQEVRRTGAGELP
jgi:hypothetical protein